MTTAGCVYRPEFTGYVSRFLPRLYGPGSQAGQLHGKRHGEVKAMIARKAAQDSARAERLGSRRQIRSPVRSKRSSAAPTAVASKLQMRTRDPKEHLVRGRALLLRWWMRCRSPGSS